MASVDQNSDARPVDIAVTDATKTFVDFWRRPKVKAVDAVSFNVTRGEVFGLLGPNGSGKSTTLKMLLGLLRPTAGDIRVLGMLPSAVRVKSEIGYVPEETYLHRFLSARETLTFHGRLYGLGGRDLRSRTDELLEMVGLAHVADRTIGEMSKGMMRRVALAQALINDPQLLILDEPTSGLDPVGRRQVKDLIIALGRRQKTILLTSHLLAEVEDVCTRIAILFNGRIHAEGRVQDLLQGKDGDVAMRLEAYFLDIIQAAHEPEGTATGAQQGMKLAPFLTGDAT
jgi:ABC-2 type transport system ATP-binding protein